MKTLSFKLQTTNSKGFIKRISSILIVSLLFLFVLQTKAQLIGWNASNNGGGFGASPWTPATINTNLNITNTGLIRGSSILTSGTPATGCWGGGGGGWGTTDAGSIYFSFTADVGYKVSLSSITSALRRSSSGPSTCNVEYSLNGGTYTTIGTWNVSSTSGTTGTANSTNLSAVAALQNVSAGTVIKFRISFPGSPGGNWYLTGATNSLKLNGTVVAVPTCTTPTGLSASTIGTNSTDLNWSAISGVNGYQYVINQAAASPTGTGTAVSTNSLNAGGLLAGTVYYAHVRTDCGGTFSSWSTISFTTASSCVSPTITAITGNTTICSNQNLHLSVAATGTGLTYTWTGAGNFSSSSVSTPTVMNAASSAYTIDVSNACGTASAVVNVTVNPLPSVSTGTASLCTGNAATLTATGADTYTWSTTQTSSSITVNPTATTSYTVSGTDLNGCTNTFTTSVTVYTLPAIAANSLSVCPGSTATLTASGANTYTWSTTQTTPSITVNPVNNSTFTVSGTDLNGCTNTFTTLVTVYTLPAISANSPSVCAGSTATLTASGADTYTWSTTQTTTSITVNPVSNSTFTVSGTNLNGCINTFTTSVTVHTLPAISANSPSVCAGTTATLSATGAATYTWSTAQSNSSITVTPTTSTSYTVIGTNLNGCTNSHTTMVTVTPTPSMAVNSATICAGKTATLTASGVTTYTWSTGAGNASITVSPTATTVYTVSGHLAGCSASTTQTTSIYVNALPSVSIAAINSAICHSSPTLNLVGSPSGGSFSGAGISGNSFNPQSAGVGTFTISYTYTATNTCSNTAYSTLMISNCTGVEELSNSLLFNAFPNPAQDVLNISFNASKEYSIQLFNTAGSLVYSKTASEILQTIHIADFSKGLYIIKVTADGESSSKRILIQ